VTPRGRFSIVVTLPFQGSALAARGRLHDFQRYRRRTARTGDGEIATRHSRFGFRDGDRRFSQCNSAAKKKKKRKKKGKSNGSGCTAQHSEQQILGFIAKAAKRYGQSTNDMERVARCESALDPCAVNRSGPYYGLFQFLKSTWNTTPYGNQNIFDPEAQALATAWMWSEGRKNEWACK